MIDLHSHVVFGYDDGAVDEEESIAMAVQYAADGVTLVAATPHVAEYAWAVPPVDLPVRCEALNRRLASLAIPVRIVPGAEMFLTPHIRPSLAARRDGHRPLGDSSYVLVEFSLPGRGDRFEEDLFGLQADGWRPILSHAERYAATQRSPERLARVLEGGVLLQVNAGSLFGDFGEAARGLAEMLVRADLVAVVATDAHRARGRRPRLRQAAQHLADLVGPEQATRLTADNPRKILANDSVLVNGDVSALRSGQHSLWGAMPA